MDEESLLACAAYVDLNPIRAALAETLEASDHTSAQRRIEAERARAGSASDAEKRGLPTDDRRMAETRSGNASPAPDRFLSPLELDEPSGEPGPCVNRSGTRCSDKGFLPISVAAYLELLDWTARQTVPGKRGSTPSDAPPILERLKVSATTWCELLSNFGRLFSTVAGHPRIVDSTRSRGGHRRFHLTARVCELLPMDPVAIAIRSASLACRCGRRVCGLPPNHPSSRNATQERSGVARTCRRVVPFCVHVAVRPSCISFPVPLDATGR